jgi:hypothetical protein
MREGNRALHRVHALLTALGLSLVIVLVLEGAARLAIWLADDVLRLGATEAAAHGSAAEGLDYDIEALLREQESLPRPSYQPYTVWRSRPYQGTYFHVDERGHRITPDSSDRPDALRIWMLGGSTVFGYGAPDDRTIPNHLARLLRDATGRPVRVENLGQGGYVSTQEMVHLLRELQERTAPQAVVFYDGYNDAVAAKNWPETPGSHFQLDRIRSRFEGAFAPLIYSSGLFRGVDSLLQRLGPVAEPPSPELARSLGEEAAAIWLRNATLVRELGDSEGFDALFFLQPARDHRILAAMGETVARTLSRESVAERPEILDLRDVFRGEEDRFFLDSVHLTGPGNERIARRIAARLVHRICLDPPLRDRFGTRLRCEDR